MVRPRRTLRHKSLLPDDRRPTFFLIGCAPDSRVHLNTPAQAPCDGRGLPADSIKRFWLFVLIRSLVDLPQIPEPKKHAGMAGYLLETQCSKSSTPSPHMTRYRTTGPEKIKCSGVSRSYNPEKQTETRCLTPEADSHILARLNPKGKLLHVVESIRISNRSPYGTG